MAFEENSSLSSSSLASPAVARSAVVAVPPSDRGHLCQVHLAALGSTGFGLVPCFPLSPFVHLGSQRVTGEILL